MRQIYYVIRTLLRGRSSNVVKVISLGLGLTMSILLFARVAFEQSFDKCFKDYDNLYQVFSIFTMNGEQLEPQDQNCGPVAGAILENFPKEVEAATSYCLWVHDPLYHGSVRFEARKLAADSLFFQTMGIEVLSGTPVKDLAQKDVVYLSDRLARKMFDTENPIGKVISYSKEIELTVKGTYADIPENATVRPEAVISLPSIWSRKWGNYSWRGGDSWLAFIRFRPGADKSVVNARIDAMIQKYRPAEDQKVVGYTAFVKPIRDVYRDNKDVRRMRNIMTILGIAILFIASLNYVLISVSSLSYRAKAVGVHKCNGAGNMTILSMFLWETAIIILFALILMGYEAMSRTPRWYYSAILPMIVLILGGLCVRYSVIGEYRFVFLPDSYYYFRLVPDKVIYFSWIAFYAALVVTCLCKNKESWAGKKRLALGISQFIILGLIFWKGFDLYGEQKSYRLKMMDYFTRTEQWDRILVSCKEPTTNQLYLCYQNMALARKGILADEAFKYTQHGPRGLMVAWNKSTTISALLSDVYFTMGNVAAAQEMAFESNIGALCDGNPRMTQRLVQTNLIYGAYPVAEKYIAVLENTFYYKDWAKAQRKFLYNDEAVETDPLLGNMRRNLLAENHLIQMDGFDTDLIRLAEQNPSNKAAFHYAGVFYLLAKDVTRFKTLVETYYGTDLLPSLPVSFQEAVIILSEKDPDYWKRFGVSESIVGRFTDYKRQVLAGRNNSNALPGLMYRSYGDTYWYYYMFK